MLVIRLSRIGRENLQKFRLVVQEKTSSPKSGKVIAILGSYDPRDPENQFVFDAEKLEQYLKNGAQPSDTVARLLIKNGFKKELVEKFIKQYTKQKSKKEKKEAAVVSGKTKPAGDAAPAEGDTKKDKGDAAKEEKAEDKKDAKPAAEEKDDKPVEKPKEKEKPAEDTKPDEKQDP
ncbi:MAG: 30S ribosomal protein S16 [Patescibacteria group bacterium]